MKFYLDLDYWDKETISEVSNTSATDILKSPLPWALWIQ